jgi:phenylacetate-CoA ligase
VVIHLFFAKDKFCRIDLGKYYYKFGWFNIDFNSSKQARFLWNSTGFYWKQKTIKRRFERIVTDSYFCLSWNSWKVLLKFQCKNLIILMDILLPLFCFVKFLQRKNIVLTSVCPTLKRVCDIWNVIWRR